MFAAWCMVAMAVMTSACALRNPPPAPPRHTDLGLAITSFTLGNGLRVVLLKDPHATQVQVTMRYQVGAVDDLDQPGMAHLVEHLMFQQVLGGQSLFATLEDITTYFNAATTYDATTYISRAPASRLDKMLSVEAVRLGFRCTSITDSTFEREREVVINEIRQTDQASAAYAMVQRAVYPQGHPYGQVIHGDVATVGAITRDQACKFVDSHYAPSNAVLVISGDVTAQDVETALGKFIARVGKRMASPPGHVASVPAQSSAVEAPGPYDQDKILIAWPMPDDPQVAIKLRALRGAVYGFVDAKVAGSVRAVELGDARAPMFGLLIQKTSDETAEDVIKHAREAIDLVPFAFHGTGWSQFDAFTIEAVKQRAIYGLYASLEDGGDRDTQLATYVLAGRDPKAALASAFAGVRELEREGAEQLVRTYFSFDRARVVSLKARQGKKVGRDLEARPEVHDMGQRRTARDPAEAHRPAENAPIASVPGVRTRKLPNGLEVVLLPVTSVPSIDIRLVFHSGATEDGSHVGVAQVAAHALEWDPRYLNDAILFTAAGGPGSVEVTGDHTTFSVRGVDMHVDVLLAGIRRWVRDGRYGDSAEETIEVLRRAARKRRNEETVIMETLMAAIFGADHPYARVGIHGDVKLTAADAAAFRAAHYTPDNATLVISGRFDADLADKWIDYLFDDWTGSAAPRSSVARAAVQAGSLARYEDIAQTSLVVALPVSDVGYADQLVTAQVLQELAMNIRHELGASYGMHAMLDESRLARIYVLDGWIDTTRAKPAIELIRDRLAALRSDPDAAARAFVSARAHVLARLSAFTGSAAALGQSVEHDVDVGRAPLADLATATAVRDLTIEHMTAALADLDLDKALVVMHGPAADVNAAFATLGRTPTTIAFDQVAADEAADDPTAAPSATPARTARRYERMSIDDLQDALTDQEQEAKHKLALKLMPSLMLASTVEPELRFELDCCDGPYVLAEVGYRIDQVKAFGLQLGVGHGTGSYRIDRTPATYPVSLTPVDIAAVVEVQGYRRLWASLSLGLHLDVMTDTDDMRDVADSTVTLGGLGVGLSAGVDLLELGMHKLGIGARVGGALGSDSGYGSFAIGLVYRL